MAVSDRVPSRGLTPRTAGAAAAAVLLLAVGVAVWLLLPGSPARPTARASAETTGTASFEAEFPAAPAPRLAGALGIAWTGSEIAVAEADAGRITLFGPEGERRRSIVLPTPAGARSAYPIALALLDAKRLLAIDSVTKRVLVVPIAEGGAVAPFASSATVKPGQPTALAVAGGEVFVADGVSHDIKVYGLDGSFRRAIAGDLAPQLTFVGGMAVASGKLYVSDSNASRGLVLDAASGEKVGPLLQRMDLPRGVAVDDRGSVYVADQFGREILQFAADGTLTGRIGGKGAMDGWLVGPRDLAFVADGRRLFVTDAQTGTVKRFDIRPGR